MDETGDLKKGTASRGRAAAVHRHRRAGGELPGRGVSSAYAGSRGGHALIDRDLYLPKSWTADPARCAAAGIAEGTAFATKPKLARTHDRPRAGCRACRRAWVTADEVYGADPGLRADLERRRLGYVLAVAATCRVTTGAGTCQARQIAAALAPAGRGSGTAAARAPRGTATTTGPGWPSTAAHARLHAAPADPPQPPHRGTGVLPLLLPPPGPRCPSWSRSPESAGPTEENFQAGKGLTGLDEHQVRRWDSWYRWTTLAMLALAFLSITGATEHAHPPPAGQIPLTRNEIAALFSTLIIEPDPRHPAPAAMVRLAATPPAPR